MALTVSSIEADFIKDTKTIGKQSAYLEFHFGDRTHATDVLKSAGKYATWETPVQLTGAGITMKIVAKASKSLAKDKPLGVGELNLVQAAGQGPQTVQLRDQLTGSPAGEVRLTISGGSPAISGLPHTEGHGVGGAVAGMMPGHHHGQQATEQGYGAGGVGGGQQGYENQGHDGALGGAAAGAGAAGLGAAALHHHNQQGHNTGIAGEHEPLGQRVEEKLPGSTTYGTNQGGLGGAGIGGPRQHETMGQRVEDHLPGHHHQHQGVGGYNQGGLGQTSAGGYNQTGQTGELHPMGGNMGGATTGMGGATPEMGNTNTGMVNNGMGSGMNSGMGGGMGSNMGGIGNSGVGNNACGQCAGAGGACPHCGGTGSLAQRMEQGLHVGGGQRTPQQGTY